MKVRDKMEKATTLSEIRRTCRYFPLDTDELTKFYVDTTNARGFDMLRKLEMYFEFVPDVYQQILYLGHTGSGKSTLLYQLEKKLCNNYKIIRFSIQEMLDSDDELSLVDLMCIMYERIFSTCKDDYQKNDEKILKSIYEKWYDVIIKETESLTNAEIQINAETEVGFKSKLVSLFAKLKSIMKFTTVEKTTVRSEMNNSINDYIKLLNDLADISSKAVGKPILLMFENLEKISFKAAKKIFITQGDLFHSIRIHMLLTTPIYLKYDMEYIKVSTQNFIASEICSMISVQDKDSDSIGFETIRKIVDARISSSLIENEALNLAIIYSGGILRDLFQMLFNASMECEMDKRSVISSADINQSFKKVVNAYGNIIQGKHVQILKNYYDNPTSIIENLNDDFVQLVRNEVIIEYANGKDQWRAIHPAVIAFLKDRNVWD